MVRRMYPVARLPAKLTRVPSCSFSYLVITRPTPSVALENFILERCEEDAHIAVIVRWVKRGLAQRNRLAHARFRFPADALVPSIFAVRPRSVTSVGPVCRLSPHLQPRPVHHLHRPTPALRILVLVRRSAATLPRQG